MTAAEAPALGNGTPFTRQPHWPLIPAEPEPASSQVKTADNPAPIVLPSVDEVVDILKEGGFYSDTARAVLSLISARLPVWQPVEPGTVIKAGTRVREDWDDQITEWTLGQDEEPYASRSRSSRYWLDPRTVPAEPVDPRAELLAEKLAQARGRLPGQRQLPRAGRPDCRSLARGGPAGSRRHRRLDRHRGQRTRC